MNASVAIAYPDVAPLSTTFINTSFEYRYKETVDQLKAIARGRSDTTQSPALHQHVWRDFVQDVTTFRATVFHKMDPLVQRDASLGVRKKHLSSDWVRSTLAHYTPTIVLPSGELKEPVPISPTALADYTSKQLLRKNGWGVPDPQSVACLLIMRMLDSRRERRWLPEHVPAEEEWWWCWAQQDPQQEPVPCPYPHLPINLPRHTLLYTRWAGAGWNKRWRSIAYLGAISFVGLREEGGRLVYDLTREDLERWYPAVTKVRRPLPEMTADTLDFLAGRVLRPTYAP